MKAANYAQITRQVARILVVLLAAPLSEAAAAQSQQPDPVQQQQQPQPPAAQQSQNPAPDPAKPQNQNEQPSAPQAGPGQQQDNDAKPLGTAVAPYEKASGVTASRPAGAVIAPARQHRVRSILIKVGVVVGAGVAIGTVAALSKSSPSHPN